MTSDVAADLIEIIPAEGSGHTANGNRISGGVATGLECVGMIKESITILPGAFWRAGHIAFVSIPTERIVPVPR